MAKGKIISIFSAKGGVGKTILSLNLAGVISNKEKKVLLIDLDLYNGGIAVALNKEVNKTIYNFCDDYSNNRYNNMEDYVTNYNNYIDYLACPKDPRQANKIDYKYLDILLDKCSFIYDYVIIDFSKKLEKVSFFITLAINEGIPIIAEAKITGTTLAEFNLIGIKDFSPPYELAVRFEY